MPPHQSSTWRAIEIVEERVDREVAPERVLVGFAEHVVAADEEIVVLVGLAFAEHVRRVAPERRDLDDLAAAEEHVREAEATADDAAVAEERADVVGARAGRDVEVLRAAVQEEIANAAADEVGLEAGALEPPHDLRRVGVDAVFVEGRVVALEAGRLVAQGRGLVAAAAIASTNRRGNRVTRARTSSPPESQLASAASVRLDGERGELGRGR